MNKTLSIVRTDAFLLQVEPRTGNQNHNIQAMKNRIIVFHLLFGILWSAYSQQADSGVAVADVRFAITTSNNVVSVGSTNIVRCLLTNGSTNSILVINSGILEVDYSAISLIGPADQSYDIMPRNPFLIQYSFGPVAVQAGEALESDIQLHIPDTIEEGKYKLEIKRRFTISDDRMLAQKVRKEVISNRLTIEIDK